MLLLVIRRTPSPRLGVPVPPQPQGRELVPGRHPGRCGAPRDGGDPLHVAAAVQAGGGSMLEDAPGSVLYC